MFDPKTPGTADDKDTIDDSVDPDTDWSLIEPLPVQRVEPGSDWSPFEPAPKAIVDHTRMQATVMDHEPETTPLPIDWSEIIIANVASADTWASALQLQPEDEKVLPGGIQINHEKRSKRMSISRTDDAYKDKDLLGKLRVTDKVNEFLKRLKFRNPNISLSLIKDLAFNG